MAQERQDQRQDLKREPSYERARDELADVVRRLEAGGLTLEESLSLWERGEHLAAVCEEWLEGARARLSAALAATQGADEQPSGNAAGLRRNGANGEGPETPF